jgi:hypothetical protein
MPWTDITQTQSDVIEILGLPAEAPKWGDFVLRKLERIETLRGQTMVAKVEGWITEWKAAETALDDAADQAGLIKADVLEWAPGSRTAGHEARMKRYALRLLNALFIPDERAEIIRMSATLGGNSVRIQR